MKRGEIILVASPGDYGKSRPAVVVQSDWLNTNDSVLLALFTSTLVHAPLYRLSIEPSETNGLKSTWQIMTDKIVTMPREKCGAVIGRLDADSVIALNHMLSVVMGIAD